MLKALLLSSVLLSLSACQSAYYSAMEKVGTHKRDIMVDRVEAAKESQQEAQQQFQSALEQLSTLIAFDGEDLQRQYDITKDNYDDAQDAADEVSDRIDSIEDVADALFVEWQNEIEQYNSQTLRQQSRDKLRQTQGQYATLIQSMRRAESSMQPVLSALKDNMLYLKHNLNAKAIGALQGEYDLIKRNVDALIKEMNASIEQSQKFIDQFEQGS
ncbi:DUF2959 domain-containing protein [Thalassotalea maritima]|uniref:DUF2959 domain-containing protein n=1 Tax=Thalassotalea maritima TaxID=3242416 RepID=UPI003527BC40